MNCSEVFENLRCSVMMFHVWSEAGPMEGKGITITEKKMAELYKQGVALQCFANFEKETKPTRDPDSQTFHECRAILKARMPKIFENGSYKGGTSESPGLMGRIFPKE